MKYVGIYWTLFAPLIKKSIAKRFNRELAQQAVTQGKTEYRGLLSRADDLGPGNPMAMNAYFAYVFAGAWLGSGKKITPDEMALVMTDHLGEPPAEKGQYGHRREDAAGASEPARRGVDRGR